MPTKKNKTEVWGFSPYKTFKDHCDNEIEDDHSIYTKLIYIPSDYEFGKTVEITRKYRNVATTATCDAGIIISGRFGTLNEFTNLHDMGKVIGVLTGTGGTADLLPELIQKISKPTKAVIIFSDSPKELVDKVLEEVRKRN